MSANIGNRITVSGTVKMSIFGITPVANFTSDTTSGPVPLSVNFTDTSTNNPTSWLWDFGDSNTSTSQNPSHTYSSGGTYTVKLTATNGIGSNQIIKTNYIAVVQTPIANFTANTTSGAIPLGINFTDTSTNSPTSWLWDFGDGNTSISNNPNHTYLSGGTYTVKLTATNAAGSNQIIRTNYITAFQTPVANFTSNTASGPVPLSVNFTDTSTNNPTSWLWDFGDSNTSTSRNPSHTYTSAGTYTVKLTATNIAGSNQIIKTNYIATAPVANFFTTDPTSGGVPLGVRFYDSSTGNPTSLLWDFGDGNTSTSTGYVFHIYNTAGTYTVKLTATNAVGSNQVIKSNFIIANPSPPVANFTSDVTSGNIPLTVNFTDTSTNNPTSWLWDFEGYPASSAQNPSRTYTSIGKWQVKLTATNAAGSGVVIKPNYITAGLAPVANFTSNVTSGNSPLSVNFTDTSTNSPTSWLWDFGDSNTSTSQNPSHTYSSDGTYTVVLTATNVIGSNQNTKTNYITVITPTGGQGYTSSGTFVVPSNVTSICVACVGGGGGAINGTGGQAGGGGGALSYVNNIAVTPGETLTVTIGPGTPGRTDTTIAANGGTSSLKRSSTILCSAGGGTSATGNSVQDAAPGLGGAVGVGTGGAGGNGYTGVNSRPGGGGGAGGFSGRGGSGGGSYISGPSIVYVAATAGSGGGAGGGGYSTAAPPCSAGGGGGAGGLTVGQGANGAAGGSGSGTGKGGKTGSLGATNFDGADGSGSTGGHGGGHGGGGGSGSSSCGYGSNGAMHICWGAGVSYPFNPV